MSDASQTFAEQNARIQQLQADALLKMMDILKREQDIRYAPFTLIFTGIGTAAALFGAAIALLKWLG
jgi:hypothetical protein